MPNAVLSVVVRRGRVQVDTPRGPTRGYDGPAARCIAFVVMRPGLVSAVLPLLQQLDPLLASALAGLTGDPEGSRALARGLDDAAGLLAAEWLGE